MSQPASAPSRLSQADAARLTLLGLLPVAVVLLAAWLTGAVTAAPDGLPDPGAFTRWALPFTALASDVAATVAVAGLLLSPLTMHKMDERMHPLAARGLRFSVAALVAWFALGVTEAWLTVSDQWALPASETSLGRVITEIGMSAQITSLSVQSALVALVLVWTVVVTTPKRALIALGLTLAALVPTILTGHSASSGSHDAAVVALLLHVAAAVVWAGGVLALWLLGAGSAASDDALHLRALRRFSAVAAWCFGVTALSGVASAVVRLTEFSDLFATSYGRAVLLKVALLAAVAAVAWRLRRALVDGAAPSSLGTLTRLTLIELVSMGAAFGLGAALSRTAPPVGEPYVGLAESLLGGPLPPAPTLERVLTTFQFSGFGTTVVVLGTVGYLMGLRTMRRRGDKWPVGRTIAWFLGLAVFAFATIGGLGVYSHVLFSLHMSAHMAISMLAPVLLVMGSPITLALRALPGPERPGGDGPKQILVAFLNSRWSKVVTNPAFATIMFTGSLYAIYFTGIYDWLMENHLGHTLMELHFLLAGYLFYEILIGTAPLPKRLPYLGRLGMLLVTAPFHAFFAIAVMSSTEVIGETYYSMLERPYSSDLLEDQNLGGGLTWAMGEIPLLIVGVALIFQWFRDDTRQAKRNDRQADRDEDAELAAYNAMLGRIADNTAVRGERDPATRKAAAARVEEEADEQQE